MFGNWTPLIWLVVTLLPLLLMQRWINRHLQGLGYLLFEDSQMALVLYFVVLLPGIIVHELSHWLMANLLGMRTGKISIWPSGRGGRMKMGSLKVAHADPFREGLVGLAPLIGGSLVVFVIGDLILGFGEAKEVLLAREWSGIGEGLWSYVHAPDFWLWLYLIFSISNAMLPSETDRRPWRTVLLFLTLIALPFCLTGRICQIPEAVTDWFLAAVSYLAYVCGLTVAVDAIFMVIIAAAEAVTVRLMGKKVRY